MNKTITNYRSFWVCLALTLITTAVFHQVCTYDFTNYDDSKYIYENSNIQSGITLKAIKWAFTSGYASNWHPLTWLSHMLDWQLFGPKPWGHHLTNLIFHIANTLLLFIVLKQMTHRLWPSAFVAALFALHPLHVESVAWVAERKDVLSTFFWMLTMWAYVRFVSRPKIASYLLVLLFFALGLMSKPMLVTLPFVLLLLDYWPLDRFSSKRGKAGSKYSLPYLLIEKAPLFVMTLVSCIVTFVLQRKGGSMMPFTLKLRISNALVSYVEYIGKMMWPSRLAVFYPHPDKNIAILHVVISAVLLLAVTILILRFSKSRRYLVTGWFWYLGTLVPVIGFVQVGLQAMADRYTYIPLIGLFIIIAWGAPDLLAKWRYRESILALSPLLIILVMSICTHFQLRYWKNSITLFQHALDVTKNNYIAHHLIGSALRKQGRLDETIYHYKKTIELNPRDSDVYLDIGAVLTAQGKFDEAISIYNKALQITPDLIELHINLGVALLESGKLEEAVKEFEKVLRVQPHNAFVHNNLGVAFLRQRKFDEAIEHFRQTIQIDPNNTTARDNLNLALSKKQKLQNTGNTKK
jgi:tetratricopeptide (TPR) repeat protein